MTKIDIQFTLFSAFYSPLIITMVGGFLKREGLEYEWSVSPPGISAVEAIIDGSAHVIQSAPSHGFSSLENGDKPPVVHFSQINEVDGFFISAREPDSDFSWAKLEGAEVVMFGGGQPKAMFQYACYKAGIDFDKIIQITPGGPDDIDKAYRDGRGWYVQQQGPYPQLLEIEGISNIVSQIGPIIGPCAFSSLAASPEWLETEMARTFIRAYTKARLYLNQASAEEIASKELSLFPGISEVALRNCISTYQKLGCWKPHTEITKEAYEVTLEVFQHTGIISKRHAYDLICCLPPNFV